LAGSTSDLHDRVADRSRERLEQALGLPPSLKLVTKPLLVLRRDEVV
jgi:hypothetical protein